MFRKIGFSVVLAAVLSFGFSATLITDNADARKHPSDSCPILPFCSNPSGYDGGACAADGGSATCDISKETSTGALCIEHCTYIGG